MLYLARPIDAVKEEDPKEAYYRLAEAILMELPHPLSVAMYLPAPAFVIEGVVDHNTAMQLVAINEHALQVCDVLVAEYLPDVPSFGVPQEIKWASDHGKFVLVLSMDCGYNELPINLKACVDRRWVFREMDELLPVLVGLLQ